MNDDRDDAPVGPLKPWGAFMIGSGFTIVTTSWYGVAFDLSPPSMLTAAVATLIFGIGLIVINHTMRFEHD
mgnify:CR=1 FL=1